MADFSRHQIRAMVLRPNGKGHDSVIFFGCSAFGSANNWQNVDEVIPNDFTDYNFHFGTSDGEHPYNTTKVDNFIFDPISLDRTIAKVALRGRVRCNNTVANATPQLLFGLDFEYQGTGVQFNSGANLNIWVPMYAEWSTNPFTGLPWTVADINGMQAGYRLAINCFTPTTVYCTQFALEVYYLAGTFWRDGYPHAGTAFGFYADADTAIRDYLVGTLANADLQSLSNYLTATVQTFEPGRYDLDLTHESPSNFPLVRIGSYLIDTEDKEPRTLMPRLETKIRIWSSRPNPQDAMAECEAIGGACLSMLRQSDYDPNAFAWTAHYNNMPLDAGNHAALSPAVVQTNPEGGYSGLVRADLTLNWLHAEDI